MLQNQISDPGFRQRKIKENHRIKCKLAPQMYDENIWRVNINKANYISVLHTPNLPCCCYFSKNLCYKSVVPELTARSSLCVSLLSHFWLIHFFPPTPALSTISRSLSSSMCSITPETSNVGCNRMRGPYCTVRSLCSNADEKTLLSLMDLCSLLNFVCVCVCVGGGLDSLPAGFNPAPYPRPFFFLPTPASKNHITTRS